MAQQRTGGLTGRLVVYFNPKKKDEIMPYSIESTPQGWFVMKKEGGSKKRKNKKPYPSHAAAMPYFRALQMAEHSPGKMRK